MLSQYLNPEEEANMDAAFKLLEVDKGFVAFVDHNLAEEQEAFMQLVLRNSREYYAVLDDMAKLKSPRFQVAYSVCIDYWRGLARAYAEYTARY